MSMLPAVTAEILPGAASLPLWASALMVVLGAGLIAMVVLHMKNARAGRAFAPAPRGPAAAAPTPATGPTPQLARELDELGKRLADELDTRADRLERLIAEADDRLNRLERMTAARVHLASDPAPTAALTELKHATAGGAGGEAPSRPAHRSAAAVMAEIDPLAGEVYKLADSGLLPVQIAQKLSQHTGKIELLLALRRG